MQILTKTTSSFKLNVSPNSSRLWSNWSVWSVCIELSTCFVVSQINACDLLENLENVFRHYDIRKNGIASLTSRYEFSLSPLGQSCSRCLDSVVSETLPCREWMRAALLPPFALLLIRKHIFRWNTISCLGETTRTRVTEITWRLKEMGIAQCGIFTKLWSMVIVQSHFWPKYVDFAQF